MVDLIDLFTIILYFLGSILLIVLIILGIRLIKTVNKVDEVVDGINVKQRKLDGLFDAVDNATDTLSIIGDRVVSVVSNTLFGIFSKKKKKGEDLEDEQE